MRSTEGCEYDWYFPGPAKLNKRADSGDLPRRFWHPIWRPARFDELILHVNHQQRAPVRKQIEAGTPVLVGVFSKGENLLFRICRCVHIVPWILDAAVADNVSENYATPHSTLFMIECGVKRFLFSCRAFACALTYQMRFCTPTLFAGIPRLSIPTLFVGTSQFGQSIDRVRATVDCCPVRRLPER